MKKHLIPILSAALALTAVAWSAVEFTAEELATAEKTKSHDLMVSKQTDIIKRLGMSAPMELPDDGVTDISWKTRLLQKSQLPHVDSKLPTT